MNVLCEKCGGAMEVRSRRGQALVDFGARFSIGYLTKGNWFAAQEREVGVLTNAKGFAERAPYSIPVDRSREILMEMGIPVPSTVPTRIDRSYYLDTVPKMTPEQTAEFLRRARAGG